jgi:uncharacterized protein (TIGR02145 family)
MKFIPGIIALSILFTHPVLPQDTIQVSKGWNNIGSLGTGASPELLLTEPPGIITTSFYGYSPGAGYQASDTLRRGLGYWIKVSGDGIIIFPGASVPESCGTKTVAYAGGLYHTVLVGNQCWLRENLNAGLMISSGSDQKDNAIIEKYCFNNDPANCATLGGLYQWDEAMQFSTTPGARGICPQGWHLPTVEDWQTLASAVGNDGNALKAVGQGTGPGAGTNTSGFSALLAGGNDPVWEGFLTGSALLWASTSIDYLHAFYFMLKSDDSHTFADGGEMMYVGFSVRCIEN